MQCLKLADTHIKNRNDGGVVPANDVGNILSLWDFGGYQLWKIGNMQKKHNMNYSMKH